MTSLDFSARIAVIAGGYGGIGQAVRARLVSAGASVIIWDLADGADEWIDLTSEAAVNEAMARLLGRFGRIDVLVNAAGITGPAVNIEDYSLAEWRRVLDVSSGRPAKKPS
ncbi:SDR family NAD(P)-dependent oxidoreductase [Bradyrhizobium cenepequi]|uniref:SDR family NAD(P)-dependent oxidoreductase n=1 Tax=Bradyrhizobium cenepequi TaxID=2821403 RepID=UPI001CE2A819|nr:SDR family NAD(P)-dependent oxidoreductase [Bradyrhizobium cenepequi]MCA6112664.1 SDR family NAD(P)-dependent oxidoreductase [Bradyrhizobium cenepequi]